MRNCLSHRAFCFLLVVALLFMPLTTFAQSATTQVGTIVNCTSYVNVRSGPGSGYAKIGTAPKGAVYPVLGTSGPWVKISFNGRTGYVYKTYIKITTQTVSSTPTTTGTRTGVVVNVTSYVNVRSGPGSGYAVIGTAPKGAAYSVTGQSGSWYKILYNAKTGYIYSNYLKVTTTSATPTPSPASTPVHTIQPTPTPIAGTPLLTTTPSAPSAPVPSETPSPNASDTLGVVSGKVLTGYYAAWAAYSGYTPLDIKAANLTHIYYAFANIGTDLKVTMGDPAIDPANFNELSRLKTQYPQLKTLISIGGWTWSDKFSDASLTDASRSSFAQSAVAFIKQYGFDGIDIDWEYPVGGGLSSNVTRPEDKSNFTKLIAELREQLDAQGTLDGRHYLLTFAGAAGTFYANNTELDQLSNYVDFATVMTYDMHGPWPDSYTDFNAPLYVPNDTSPQYQWSCEQAVDLWVSQGFAKSKLLMGVPFYGVKFNGVANVNNGLYQKFTSGSTLSYDTIMASYSNNQAFKKFVHSDAQAPWLYNGSTFISYDDLTSIAGKGTYIGTSGLGGATIWELSQNESGMLIDTLYDNMNK